jgi:SAM-dependent methyltransferase
MQTGERQVAPTLAGIRRDHVARYEWAAQVLKPGRLIDLACGIGYGSKILAEAGSHVTAIDKDAEAIDYGQRYYAHERVSRSCADANEEIGLYDAAVCFETIEHIENPLPMLRNLRCSAKELLASVPNEAEFPWRNYAFHFRHYTKSQFESLLNAAGWHAVDWFGQEGAESEVTPGAKGRTIIARCVPGKVIEPVVPEKIEKPAAPKHVAIVGLGPSAAQYMSITRGMGGRHKFCDETWVINAFGDVFACDRVFHMDDVRVQEIRAAAAPESNIAAMLQWLREHPGPVVTSRTHPDYPGLEAFPLQQVLGEFPFGYFNSTAAYAIAYAIWIGVAKITIFGFDFTYPNAHDAEKGRACVEFWLGIAAARGIQLAMPKTTTLMDALHPQGERFYGYDCVDLSFTRKDGQLQVEFTEKASLPTAEEIEASYDHSRHPNALVDAEDGAREAPETAAARRAPEVK